MSVQVLEYLKNLIIEKHIEETGISVGKECQLCGEVFTVAGIYDARVICPKCKEKWRTLVGNTESEVE